jgi:hypothetical protein
VATPQRQLAAPAPLALTGGPILALGLMGVGMIAADDEVMMSLPDPDSIK